MPDWKADKQKVAIVDHLQTIGKHLDQKNVKGLTTHFASDAVFVAGAGATVGKHAIAKRYDLMYGGRFKNAQNVINEVLHVQTPHPNVAIVTASCVARGIMREQGDPVPDLKSNVVTMMVKTGANWEIVAQAVVNESATKAAKQVAALK